MKNDQEEFKDYVAAGFEPVETEDGSLTLKQKGLGEEMHARGGAMSESIYIYYEALELFFKSCKDGDEVEVLSIGLGLGYNEVLAAASYLKSDLNFKIKILSFEKEKALDALFLKRLESPKDFPVYWKMFEKLGEVEPEKIKAVLKNSLSLNGLFGEVAVSNLKNAKRIILFDAYSNNTSEELWTEEVLSELLNKSEEGSVFTTYAATGVLNRALKTSSFENLKRSGFLHKRESSLAVKRNCLMSS